jgi:hypothetical protein
MKLKLLFLISLFGISAMGCERIPEAVGNDTGITVVADSTIYAAIRPALEAALQKEIYTPQPEYLLKMSYLRPEELNKVVVRPNIIMAGLLNAEDRTSKQVRGMLPAGAMNQVEQQESFVFRKENPWARKQLLLVLVSTDTSVLKEQIIENSDYLFEVLRNHVIDLTKAEMYSQFEQKSIGNDFLEKYQWRLRVQHDYVVWQEDEKDHFVMLRRTSPERWLFVYWEDSVEPDNINADWLISKRNEIGRRYYENDKIADKYLSIGETEFAGRRAVELCGLWENEQKVAGGPFKAFAFYDEDTQRAYLVDISAFAPGQEKEEFMRQLEIMARTFRTAADVKRGS